MKKKLTKETGMVTKDVDAKKEDVLIQALKRDAQLREIDSAVVAAYIQDLESGAAFPPIVVFRDEANNLWLADGFHRVDAAVNMKQLERMETKELRTFQAEIRTGTLDDAKWYSYGANKTNGFYRSNKVKRRAVNAALEHPRATKMSNMAIAKHVGVSEGLVRGIKVERDWERNLSSNVTKIREVTRNGKTYEQDVSRIGKLEDASEPRLDDRVALPNVDRSLKKLYEIVQEANQVVRDIQESVAGGSTLPMPPEDRIEVMAEVRDGLDALIRWKTHAPSDFELQELKRAVMLREQVPHKVPKMQESADERVA